MRFALLLLFCLLPASVSGQCLFEEHDAIADTLDPTGYYPLEVGNRWEYVNNQGSTVSGLRVDEVVSDTLIDGVQYFVIASTQYYPEPRLPRDPPTGRMVRASSKRVLANATGGLLTFYTPDSVPTEVGSEQRDDSGERNLAASFNTCGPYFVVDKYPISSVSIGSDAPFEVAAIKRFINASGHDSYAYGIGPIRYDRGSTSVQTIAFAEVGGATYGMPVASSYVLIATSIGEVPPVATVGLEAYPNPSAGTMSLSFTLAERADVRLSIYDALGREVARLVDSPLPPGSHTTTLAGDALPSGAYVYRFSAGSQQATGTLVLAR